MPCSMGCRSGSDDNLRGASGQRALQRQSQVADRLHAHGTRQPAHGRARSLSRNAWAAARRRSSTAVSKSGRCSRTPQALAASAPLTASINAS